MWAQRVGLGLPPDPNEDDSSDSSPRSGDYSPLVLTDGREIPANQVASLIHTVDDIVSLRVDEFSESLFEWARVVDQQTLTSDSITTLIDAFNDGSWSSYQVAASAAEAAERNGDHSTALRLAADIIQNAPSDTWHRDGTRLRAAAVAVRLGNEETRIAACQDLACRVINNRWSAAWFVLSLDSIVTALDPSLSAAPTWPEVRTYLDGMAKPLDLAQDDVLTDHSHASWQPATSGTRPTEGIPGTPDSALAELAVRCLCHQDWHLRGAAHSIVV